MEWNVVLYSLPEWWYLLDYAADFTTQYRAGKPIDWNWWTLACCHYDGTVSPKLIAAEIAESMAYEGR